MEVKKELLLRLWLLEKIYKETKLEITINQAKQILSQVMSENNLEFENTSHDMLIAGIVQASYQSWSEQCLFKWETWLINYLIKSICSVLIMDWDIKKLLENNKFTNIALNRIRVIWQEIRAITPQNLSSSFRRQLIELKKQEIPDFVKGENWIPYQMSLSESYISFEQLFPDIIATYQDYVNKFWYKKISLKKVIEYICEEKWVVFSKSYVQKAKDYMNIIRREQLEPSLKWIKWLEKIQLNPLPIDDIQNKIKELYDIAIQNLDNKTNKGDILYFNTTKVFPDYQIWWWKNWCRWILMGIIAKNLWLNDWIQEKLKLYWIDWFWRVLKSMSPKRKPPIYEETGLESGFILL